MKAAAREAGKLRRSNEASVCVCAYVCVCVYALITGNRLTLEFLAAITPGNNDAVIIILSGAINED